MPNCCEVSLVTAFDDESVAVDRATLIALYNATAGAGWLISTNWLSDRPLDEWHGVTTNSDGRVARLELIRIQLTGPIPAELGALTNLESLLLVDNQLTGPIPAELGDLAKLRSLVLFGNQLTGPIPARLGDLTESATELSHLGQNRLTGPIPAGLRDPHQPANAGAVAHNQLTGPIPA